MVLDEASPTAPDTFSTSDNVTDDTDLYSSPDSHSTSSKPFQMPSNIDLSQFSRPMPILGPLLGYRDPVLKKIIEYDAAAMSAIIQRPLTQPEWEATAFHMAKMQSYASYGWPIGMAWGALRAQRTMKEWRFPFYKPDLEKIGHDRFNRFLSLRGDIARTAWQSLRFGIWMGLVGAAAKITITVFGVNVALAGQRVDERLKPFWNTLNTLDRNEIRRRRQNAGMVLQGSQHMGALQDARDGFEEQMGSSDQSQRQQQRQPQQGQQVPQGNQSVWAQRRAAAARGELPTPANAQAAPAESPQASQFEFDDASPMAMDAPEERQQSPQQSQQPQQQQRGGPAENVWDRIKRGNGPEPVQGQPARPLQGAQGDAWAKVRGGGNSSEQN